MVTAILYSMLQLTPVYGTILFDEINWSKSVESFELLEKTLLVLDFKNIFDFSIGLFADHKNSISGLFKLAVKPFLSQA